MTSSHMGLLSAWSRVEVAQQPEDNNVKLGQLKLAECDGIKYSDNKKTRYPDGAETLSCGQTIPILCQLKKQRQDEMTGCLTQT